MARVTVEDCVALIPNRFELVMVSAQRARDLAAGAALTVDRDRDKNPVVALREIADETIDTEALRETLVKGHQRAVDADLPEDDIIELMAGEQGWIQQAGDASGSAGGAADADDMDGDDDDDAGMDDDLEDGDDADVDAEAETEDDAGEDDLA